jgi:hypothetical protein
VLIVLTKIGYYLMAALTIGAILYKTALVGAFGTIPTLGSLLNKNGAGSLGKDGLSSYGGAG